MHAKHLSTTAKIPHAWEFIHDDVGYNYRLPNINAALGCAQLEKLPTYLEQKRLLAKKYQDIFNDLEGVSLFSEPSDCRSNYWLNILLLDQEDIAQRDEVLKLTNTSKIMTRPAWKLMHELQIYKPCPSMELEISKEMENRMICLPSSVKL
jgi:perosamine synthetase